MMKELTSNGSVISIAHAIHIVDIYASIIEGIMLLVP